MDNLIVDLVVSVIGLAYFAYGKRQQRISPMVCGVLLGLCPMFTDNPYLLALFCAVLLAVPFFTDF